MSGLTDVRADAVHGSFCPKMCTFRCPVVAATGDERTVPWALHTAVAALATGARPPDGRAYRALRGCTGCHACRDVCLYELDVPAQVRAGRAAVVAAGDAPPAVEAAVAHVAAGRSPYGGVLASAPAEGEDAAGRPDGGALAAAAGEAGSVTVVAGCRDEPAVLAAADRLLAAAGVRADWVVPWGCCGATLHDLGAAAAARERLTALRSRLAGGDGPVLATDPHCLTALRAAAGERPVGALVAHLAELADRGRLRLGAAPTAAYHDPCVLARDEHVWTAPRRLLAAAGAGPAEPEGSGATTVCSGAGMALDLVDPPAASAVAARRAGQLAAVGAPVVTACARARQRLAATGLPVQDLFAFLASYLLAAEPAVSDAQRRERSCLRSPKTATEVVP